MALALTAVAAVGACKPRRDLSEVAATGPAKGDRSPRLGAFKSNDGVTFKIQSNTATAMRVYVFAAPFGKKEDDLRTVEADLEKGDGNVWTVKIPMAKLTPQHIFYGYRAWGPNWPKVESWKPGSQDGFKSHVDAAGNRFNPNKLLLDPYALEVSHDPTGFFANRSYFPRNQPGAIYVRRFDDGTIYGTGPEHYLKDSAPEAPKGIIMDRPIAQRSATPRPNGKFKDDIIYEVHLAGLTKADPDFRSNCAGTYKAAGMKAKYLKDLGITAVEFLPLHEFDNEQNELTERSTKGDNYWGYMTMNFFAPDRKYACDQTAGGPTRELKEMVEKFHAVGIKVILDVVYNHTQEGGLWGNDPNVAMQYSYRGIDNAAYYNLSKQDKRYYINETGTGNTINVTSPAVKQLVKDSLAYYYDYFGFDGFRFDLGVTLGNVQEGGGYQWGPGRGSSDQSLMSEASRFMDVRTASRAVSEPAHDGPDFTSEPWTGDGSGQIWPGGSDFEGKGFIGRLPDGWTEWNGWWRDEIRKAQNKEESSNLHKLKSALQGSPRLYRDSGRRPWHSVNKIVAHDGLTLFDLYACNGTNNMQPWPKGPSDGGASDNISWDQGEKDAYVTGELIRGNNSEAGMWAANKAATRQAVRTGYVLQMTSAGVPMLTGGDEFLRTQFCNNNVYNLDSDANWLGWRHNEFQKRQLKFSTFMHALRRKYEFFRPADWATGGTDDTAMEMFRQDGEYADNDHFTHSKLLIYNFTGARGRDDIDRLLVIYNKGSNEQVVTLPKRYPGAWLRVVDTSRQYEEQANIWPQGDRVSEDGKYKVAARSAVILVQGRPNINPAQVFSARR